VEVGLDPYLLPRQLQLKGSEVAMTRTMALTSTNTRLLASVRCNGLQRHQPTPLASPLRSVRQANSTRPCVITAKRLVKVRAEANRVDPKRVVGERRLSVGCKDEGRIAAVENSKAAPQNEGAGATWWKLAYGMPLLAIPGLNLEGPGSVAEALLVLASIVCVHECGHFFAARLQNIYVTKFAIGFGPELLKYKGPEVEYSLRAFPLGGFVAFPDDDPDSPYDPEDPNLLRNRPIKDRAIVISAGVIANVIFAYTVLVGQVGLVGVGETTFKPGVLVPELLPVSAAAKGGVKTGDIILGVDGAPIEASSKSVQYLVDRIKDSPNVELMFRIARGEEQLDVAVIPDKASDGGGRIGVQLASNVDTVRRPASSVGEVFSIASYEFQRLGATVVGGLQQIIFNFAATKDQVSGPIAIVAVGAEVARNDIAGLFQFAAIVNINLAVVNVLPLPALDGGYLLLLLVEAARGGKKVPQDVEQAIMSSGFLLLLGLGVALILRDSINLLSG